MPRPRKTEKENKGMVKTTVVLPEKLWEQAKLAAVLERKDFRTVVIEALEGYLAKKPKRRRS